MRRKYLFFAFCLFGCFIFSNTFSQGNSINTSLSSKPLIDSSVYRNWPSVNGALLSNNGEYVSYTEKNIPHGSWTTVIKSTLGNWEMRIPGGSDLDFTNDSRMAVYKKSNDSLFILKLGGSAEEVYSNVIGFEILKKTKKDYLIINRQGKEGNDLVLYDFTKHIVKYFQSVSGYVVSKNGETLVMLKDTIENNHAMQSLVWLDMDKQRSINIVKGSGFSNLKLDADGKQLVFLNSSITSDTVSASCLYYKLGDKRPKVIFDDKLIDANGCMNIKSVIGFNSNGTLIFFYAEKGRHEVEKRKDDIVTNPAHVRIWSYLDKKLQSAQDATVAPKELILYSYSIRNHDVYPLTKYGEIMFKPINKDKGLLVYMDPESDMGERWNPYARFSSCLVSAVTGERTKLNGLDQHLGSLSPKENFVIFNDLKDYFIYDIKSGEYRNITKGIDANWLMLNTGDKDSIPRGVAGWIKDDEGVLIYDKYDIWLIDPKGVKSPINVTNGFGRKHHIIFYLGLSEYNDNEISKDADLILNATGVITKQNGFFKAGLKNVADPELLTFASYAFDLTRNFYVDRPGFSPIKARDTDRYIVSRMSATESLNFFFTSDFKTFSPVSHIFPEKSYNWYTTELHSWRTKEGNILQGVLYKPENFDSSKVYPIIFNYYEKRSFDLNVCQVPGFPTGDINIPTYVSNGYLVFTPDFEYKVNDPMEGPYSSITSAVEYLSKMPFINTKRMGIQGFSMGGVETYYLVANTNLFAAACATSGQTNFISSYGTIGKSGHSLQGLYEGGQIRMGGTPWNLTDMYIKNSAIFKANMVTSPLLIVHTTNDEVCPLSQAIEFYTALRRLGKKVWMLEYTDCSHSIQGKSSEDYYIRMAQFFDHYLKGTPIPEWMSSNDSAKSK